MFEMISLFSASKRSKWSIFSCNIESWACWKAPSRRGFLGWSKWPRSSMRYREKMTTQKIALPNTVNWRLNFILQRRSGWSPQTDKARSRAPGNGRVGAGRRGAQRGHGQLLQLLPPPRRGQTPPLPAPAAGDQGSRSPRLWRTARSRPSPLLPGRPSRAGATAGGGVGERGPGRSGAGRPAAGAEKFWWPGPSGAEGERCPAAPGGGAAPGRGREVGNPPATSAAGEARPARASSCPEPGFGGRWSLRPARRRLRSRAERDPPATAPRFSRGCRGAAGRAPRRDRAGEEEDEQEGVAGVPA